MQKQQNAQRSSGSKAVAIDKREQLIRYRLLLLLAALLVVATAFGIYQIFLR